MAKRFTDTTIWKNQKWFKKLDPIHKLAWKYITDLCDHAGIWKIDIGELTDDLGLEEFSLEEFISQCNIDYDKKTGKKFLRKRVLIVKDDYLWLTGFIKFQYEGRNKKVDATSKVAASALEILNGFGLLHQAVKEDKFFDLKIKELSPVKPHQAPSSPTDAPANPLDPLEGDKVKVKVEEEGDNEKGAVGEKLLLCPEMVKVFKQSYPSYADDQEKDYPSCASIAYKIAKMRNWTKHSVTNGNLPDVLQEWRTIVVFSKSDPWFSTRAISDFDKEFQRLTQKMNNGGTANNSRITEEKPTPTGNVATGGFGKLQSRRTDRG